MELTTEAKQELINWIEKTCNDTGTTAEDIKGYICTQLEEQEKQNETFCVFTNKRIIINQIPGEGTGSLLMIKGDMEYPEDGIPVSHEALQCLPTNFFEFYSGLAGVYEADDLIGIFFDSWKNYHKLFKTNPFVLCRAISRSWSTTEFTDQIIRPLSTTSSLSLKKQVEEIAREGNNIFAVLINGKLKTVVVNIEVTF